MPGQRNNMNILIATAEYEHKYTAHSLTQAFRDIGHRVITCGPLAGNYDLPIKGKYDIPVLDKKDHPEAYTYDEIIYRSYVKPDLILQIDPHFYFVGNKPKDIPCAYYAIDVHRGADVFRRMALKGQFDHVFIAYKHFMPLFEKVGLNCHWLPLAFDDTYIREYPEIDIECDISFIGETGISEELLDFPNYDNGVGAAYHSAPFKDIDWKRRYRSFENGSMEYAERAEILIRLSRDFDLRVYKETRGAAYPKAICRGKIVVNHSLWKDTTLRNYEVPACNRFLISDIVPYQDRQLIDKTHYAGYEQYFQPNVANFDLEYEVIRDLVRYYLDNDEERHRIVGLGRKHVENNHTFKDRARQIIDTVFDF